MLTDSVAARWLTGYRFEYQGNDFDIEINYRDVLRNVYKTACHYSGGTVSQIVMDRFDVEGKRIERIIGEGG